MLTCIDVKFTFDSVFAMFLAIILPSSSCSSYSWNEWSVRHFSFHNENKSTSSPGLLG